MLASVPERKKWSFQPPTASTGTVDAVEDVDERAVAPVVVERGMGAVGGELAVGVDRAAARHGGDVGPAVDLAALGRLHAAREDHVVVQRPRRLHRGDREEVLGPFDRRAVAGLAAEALAEHADPAVAELLRRQPLDEVVGVAAALPEAAVLPPATRFADAAHRPDERGVAAGGEEVGLAGVEVGEHDVGRELDDEAREPARRPARRRGRAGGASTTA